MSILRQLLPDPDASRSEHRLIDAPIAVVYEAALAADFLDAVRRNVVVRTLFALRSAAERSVAFVRRRPFEEPPTPASLRLKDLPVRGEWVRLGEDPPFEFAFGVIGKFWSGETRWLSSDASLFARFREPGFARIGCQLLLISRGTDRTLVFYETRTEATDAFSKRRFLRYWRVVSPFVGYIMRATLAVIARKAIAAPQVRPVSKSRELNAPVSAGARIAG